MIQRTQRHGNSDFSIQFNILSFLNTVQNYASKKLMHNYPLGLATMSQNWGVFSSLKLRWGVNTQRMHTCGGGRCMCVSLEARGVWCVHTWGWGGVCAHVCECGGQRGHWMFSTNTLHLRGEVSHLERHLLSERLAGQRAPWIPFPQHWDCRHTSPYLTFMWVPEMQIQVTKPT